MQFWGPHAGQTAFSCTHAHHNLAGCILIWQAAFQIISLSFASQACLQSVHHHPPAVLLIIIITQMINSLISTAAPKELLRPPQQ